MGDKNGKRGVVFLHFPKTAGTTYGTYLSKHCPGKGYGFASWHAVGPKRLEAPEGVLKGHMTFEQVSHLQGKSLFVTIMRHPLERSISLYQHMRRVPGSAQHEQAMSLSLDEYLHQGIAANQYLMLLAGVPDWEADPPRLRQDPDPAARLDKALGRLSCFDHIGSIEDLGSSMTHLARLIGVAPPATIGRLNQGAHQRTDLIISADAVEAFEELAEADLRIYKRAMELRDLQYLTSRAARP